LFQNLLQMKSKNYRLKKKKSFKQAVLATSEVKFCYQKGIGAIPRKERNKVELTDSKKCGGSLFIDKCLINQKKYPQENRWDYAIDYNGETFFFEVHTASTGEVSTVLSKLEWLKGWLRTKAPEINALKAKNPFYWVQSNGCHILRNSAQEREVNQKGLKPIPKLVLK
jgi:hypothetical protein